MKFIPTTVTNKLGRHILKAAKHSPQGLFVVGIAGVIGSTVLACRATMKLETKLNDFTNEVDELKSNPETKEYRRDMAYVYAKNTVGIVRMYAPAIVVGTAAIGALTGSHVTLTRRNTSLTAAYSAVAMSFDAYRDRVRAEIGDEKELSIRQDILSVVTSKDGVVESVGFRDPNKLSTYARIFDESSTAWVKNPEQNRIFVQCQQNYANDLLQARGHVFLNEVYDMLGIDRSQAGQVVGWVIGDNGDNYIDFHMFHPDNAAFINGSERSIVLDFNVDGVIMNLI